MKNFNCIINIIKNKVYFLPLLETEKKVGLRDWKIN